MNCALPWTSMFASPPSSLKPYEVMTCSLFQHIRPAHPDAIHRQCPKSSIPYQSKTQPPLQNPNVSHASFLSRVLAAAVRLRVMRFSLGAGSARRDVRRVRKRSGS